MLNRGMLSAKTFCVWYIILNFALCYYWKRYDIVLLVRF